MWVKINPLAVHVHPNDSLTRFEIVQQQQQFTFSARVVNPSSQPRKMDAAATRHKPNNYTCARSKFTRVHVICRPTSNLRMTPQQQFPYHTHLIHRTANCCVGRKDFGKFGDWMKPCWIVAGWKSLKNPCQTLSLQTGDSSRTRPIGHDHGALLQLRSR